MCCECSIFFILPLHGTKSVVKLQFFLFLPLHVEPEFLVIEQNA